MKLSRTQALNFINTPANASFIRLAQRQEDRLVMHSEPLTEKGMWQPAVMEFMAWVKSFLPDNKFKRFEQLVTFPLPTVDSTDSIFDELGKFFDAPDRNIKSAFSSPVYEQEFNSYLEPITKDFWEVKAFEALKTGINSFIIVDLPAQQKGLRPEPYFYLLSIHNVHDVEVNEDSGNIEYIIFNTKNNRKVVIDELAYRVYRKLDTDPDWTLDIENIHSRYVVSTLQNGEIQYGDLIDGLGYTPACSFYSTSIKGSKHINKKGPLTSSLGNLDWLLFWRVSQKYLNLYGAWPIVVSYKGACKYRDAEGNECTEGYVNYSYQNTANVLCKAQRECPVCQKRGLVGAGSHLEVDPPASKDDVDLMLNPMKFIEISNDKLEYGVDETERLEKEIFINTVGFYQEATQQAQNEKQVQSQFESQKAILDGIRKQFERCIKFANDTTAKLRYGNYFTSSNVFLGREYFLQSAQDLMDQYANAKKVGLPMFEISQLRESYSKTKYRNNSTQFQRSFILAQLEPYPDYSSVELRNLGINTIDPINFALKLDFSNYIAKFEREQLNVVDFGSLIDFQTKISIIQKKLIEYVTTRFSEAKASAQLIPGAATGTTA